jgi:hypothetical protein
MCDLADLGQRLLGLNAVGAGDFVPERNWLFRPATRISKNSSMLLEKISRNFSRSIKRRALIQRLFQHAIVELQLRQLAMDVIRLVVDVDGRRVGAVTSGALRWRRTWRLDRYVCSSVHHPGDWQWVATPYPRGAGHMC